MTAKELLKKSDLGTILLFTDSNNKTHTVYYKGYKNGKYWCNYNPNYTNNYQNDVALKLSSITKVGKEYPISKDELEARIQMMKDDKQQMYKDAYKRDMMYPNVDEKILSFSEFIIISSQ
jgi:hypothetical protein